MTTRQPETKNEKMIIHEAEYITTNDGIIGVVVGGTKNFIDAEMENGQNWRFSLKTRRQYNAFNRWFHWGLK